MTAQDSGKLGSDLLLLPYLAADDSAVAERALEGLIEMHAAPRIREIVNYKMLAYTGRKNGSCDSTDVQHDVILQLITRLAELRRDPLSRAIRNFRSYVAVIAYRSCYNYLRRKYPQRYSLKQKLRRTLEQHEEFDCWEAGAVQWVCGLARWRNDTSRVVMREGRATAFREQAPFFADPAMRQGASHRSNLPDLLALFFKWADQPVDLDDLVGVVAGVQGINDECFGPESPEWEDLDRRSMPGRNAGVADQLLRQAYLKKLWQEIEDMTLGHRAALLLNLRDEQGDSPIELFPFTGIASFARIADVMGMTVEELAAVWNHLPMDDAAIAQRLGLQRQQVINLRNSARERLARRLKSQGF